MPATRGAPKPPTRAHVVALLEEVLRRLDDMAARIAQVEATVSREEWHLVRVDGS